VHHRLPLAALVLLIGALASRPADAQVLLGEVRAVEGSGDDDAMRIGLLAAGLRWQVAPTLDVHAVALGLTTHGRSDIGEPAAGGAGGEIGFRVTPWPGRRVAPVAGASLGLLGFPGRPFLPGADVYEGIITFGGGVDVRLDGRWTLALAVSSVHLSNGQGLGAHNPAFDGVGVAAAVSYRVRDAVRGTDVRAAPPPPAPAPAVDGTADVELGGAGDLVLAAARVRPSMRVGDAVRALLDVEAGALDGEAFVEAGLAFIATTGVAITAAQLGYRWYAGIDIPIATVQAEIAVTPEARLVAMGHHERPSGLPSVWRAGAGVRLEPVPSLSIDLGVGFDRLGDDTVFGDDHSDPYLGIIWRSPLRVGGRHLAVFLERQISTVDLLGIRLDAAGPSWRRLR
jgi:hypothetical protein